MSTIAEVTVPAETLALEELFDAHQTARIEFERLASHSREWVMPTMWLRACDPHEAARTIEADPAVDRFDLVDVEAETAYACIHWGTRIRRLVDEMVARHGVVKEASAAGGVWSLTLKFTERDALADFRSFATDQGLSVELRRLGRAPASIEHEYGLTNEQREVMETALELGYFSVPRRAQLADLADALDVSTNAASERLRRATRRLASNTIGVSSSTNRP